MSNPIEAVKPGPCPECRRPEGHKLGCSRRPDRGATVTVKRHLPSASTLEAAKVALDNADLARHSRSLAELMIATRDLIEYAEGLEASREPCDGGCNYNDGPDEECSAHGRRLRELWGFLEELTKERNALKAVIAEALDFSANDIRYDGGTLGSRMRRILSTYQEGKNDGA